MCLEMTKAESHSLAHFTINDTQLLAIISFNEMLGNLGC